MQIFSHSLFSKEGHLAISLSRRKKDKNKEQNEEEKQAEGTVAYEIILDCHACQQSKIP